MEPSKTTWKIANTINRFFLLPIVKAQFMIHKIDWPIGGRFFGLPIIQKFSGSIMQFGANFQLRSTSESNPIGVNHPVVLCTWSEKSTLVIGDDFGMTGGSIVAAEKIIIGDRVNIGANSIIIDTDFHYLNFTERNEKPEGYITKPIFIEDDVFIGTNSIILKGVRLGKGCVIGAGSVVTKDIPPYTIAAGNPCKVIKKVI